MRFQTTINGLNALMPTVPPFAFRAAGPSRLMPCKAWLAYVSLLTTCNYSANVCNAVWCCCLAEGPPSLDPHRTTRTYGISSVVWPSHNRHASGHAPAVKLSKSGQSTLYRTARLSHQCCHPRGFAHPLQGLTWESCMVTIAGPCWHLFIQVHDGMFAAMTVLLMLQVCSDWLYWQSLQCRVEGSGPQLSVCGLSHPQAYLQAPKAGAAAAGHT